MFFISAFTFSFSFFGLVAHTLVPRHWWLPTWGLHGPCVLVDSARPDGARGRNHTPSPSTYLGWIAEWKSWQYHLKCESDRYKVGYDPIHIRVSDPDLFSTKVCVYTERIDNFLRARAPSGLLREAIVFPPFLAIFENFCLQFFFLSSDNEVRSKRFKHAFVIFEGNFPLKDVYISSGRWSIAATVTARKTLRKGSLVTSFLFTRFSSSKSSF